VTQYSSNNNTKVTLNLFKGQLLWSTGPRQEHETLEFNYFYTLPLNFNEPMKF
jgi:hypothetical protein